MRLARGASDDGAEAVVVLGGDGTLNEAANGLAGTKTALGVLPGGSTNVFARTIGHTNDPLDATAELLDAMDSNRRRRIGLGKANNRYFLFHVGVGFDAAVVETVEKRSSLKRYAGHPLFVWSSLLTWAKFGERKSPRFSVRFNNNDVVDSYLTICLNSNPYTYLGNMPFNIAPGLDFEHGMTVVSVKSLRFPSLTGLVASALLAGKRLRHNPKADFREDVQSCEVTGYGKFPYQLDGDYLGDVDALSLRHEPEILDVLMPRT
jgi:diacylglycerol kinase family enzyme